MGDVDIVTIENARELGKTISNPTAQQIINHIKKHKGVTASQIAKALDIPASTTHYNLKALVQSKLVDDSNYTYSSKGKVVNHYEVSNKVIVILPSHKSPELLKSLIPGILGLGVLGLGYGVVQLFNTAMKSGESMQLESLAMGNAKIAVQTTAIPPSPNPLHWLWGVLIGAGIISLGVVVYWLLKKRTISK